MRSHEIQTYKYTLLLLCGITFPKEGTSSFAGWERTKKNQALQGTTGLLSDALGDGTDVVTGIMFTVAGQVVNVVKPPVIVFVASGVSEFALVLVELPDGVLIGGKNVKTSPFVVMTCLVVKLVGTGIVLVPQTKKLGKEVSTTPSGKVLVNSALFPVGIGKSVGIKVNTSPNTVVVTAWLETCGIFNAFVPQFRTPAEKVTTTPSGRVLVEAGAPPEDTVTIVGIKVNISPNAVVVTG